MPLQFLVSSSWVGKQLRGKSPPNSQCPENPISTSPSLHDLQDSVSAFQVQDSLNDNVSHVLEHLCTDSDANFEPSHSVT